MAMTRFEKLLATSSRERPISQCPYEIRERSIGVKRRHLDPFREEYAQLASISKSPSRSELEMRAFEDEIKAAEFILTIQQEEGSEDFVPYSRETLSRATDFLRRYLIHAHTSNLVGAGVPTIGPADHGSIDLYWESANRTLLINFPSTEDAANFYGKKPKSQISGRFDPSEVPTELVIFLAD